MSESQEHQSGENITTKGTATLIEVWHNSRVSTNFNRTHLWKTSSGLSGNRVLVYSQGVRMENQLDLEKNMDRIDTGVKCRSDDKGPADVTGTVRMPWRSYIC
jgi:iron complex outermembrane receptor protein